MHPMKKILEWLPKADFAVLSHGFAPHGRDYVLLVEDCLGTDPGHHELVFTHCVRSVCETRVGDDVWPGSWSDEFTDYARWQQAGEPSGYVWGTNWSNAYPGVSFAEGSAECDHWSDRLGKPFYEVALETDRFCLNLIFHSIQHRKVSDDTDTISQLTVPLPPSR